jgi:hypothetical protein
MSQAKLLISVFLRLTFVSGWFVFSHVTSQAFDFCVFEIDVCEWAKKNANHPLTNVNLKNTEIKSLACDVRKHEPPTHKRQSQKHRNQKLGL